MELSASDVDFTARYGPFQRVTSGSGSLADIPLATNKPCWPSDPAISTIAIVSGVPKGAAMALSIYSLERSFDRLTLVALGRPASHEDLPEDKAFAATLLILRELMHHLQFAAIHYVDRPDQA